MLHQLVGNIVQNGKAVAHNGIQLHLQPVLHDLRQLIPVPSMSLSVGKGLYGLLGARNGRRIKLIPIRHGLNLIHHIRDFIGIGDHNLIGCFLA